MTEPTRCIHAIPVDLPCQACADMVELPSADGWYRVICYAPDGVSTVETGEKHGA
jgi:hypothetical protein